MRLSLNWLKRYLKINLTAEKIAEILTTIGLEVESVEEVELVPGGLKGVVTGWVKSCEKHPDADKLSVTIVDTGAGELLQIVCGAPNVAQGQKVLVATIGTILYSETGEEFKIKKSKIRGVDSHGMICSEAELGLSKDHSGIAILPADTPLGISASKVLNLENDTVFEIGLTPNRSDATSQLGVARDLLAYLKVNENMAEELNEPDLSAFVTRKIPFNIQVEVHDKDACPRYSGAVIYGVEVKESPEWLKHLLISVGVRPINNIVDITNFVLHEYGQPLHAFDADKIKGSKVNVTTLQKGTKFITLDGVERTIEQHDLMICDGEMNPMCMAGVFGGASSGVTTETKNIFLESAYFSPAYTRRTSMSHNLRTDAAKIFEKGADPNITLNALKRACILITDLAGGTVGSDMIDFYPSVIAPAEIRLRYSKVWGLTGIDIPKDAIHNILLSMEMEISPVDHDSILVQVPTNKPDVTREVDIIEEIVRIYGLNRIPVSSKISSTISYTEYPSKKDLLSKIAIFLASRGFHEMMGISLIESSNYADLNPEEFVYVNNTSNIHLNVMRPDMLVSGLLSVAFNQNRQQNQIALFEIGKSYRNLNGQISEKEKIGIFLSGAHESESWRNTQSRNVNFYDLKNVVDSVLARTGIREKEIQEKSEADFNYCLEYTHNSERLAIFGEVSGKLLKSQSIKQQVYFAEFEIDNLLKALCTTKVKVQEISKYPSVRRDLALILDKPISFSVIKDAALSAEKKNLKNIQLFDIYENTAQLGEGKKSYAISFIFESLEKTLMDSEVERMMEKISTKIINETGAIVRR